MPAISAPVAAAIISTAGGIGSSLIAKHGQKQTNTSSQQSSNIPQVAPEYQPLQQQLITSALNRLNQPLPQGTLESGLSNINRISKLGAQTLTNDLTSRGLSTSPIAANVMTKNELARQGQLSNFENVAFPTLQQQFSDQGLELARSILSQGIGNQSQGTNSGTNVNSTSPLGAGFSTAAQLLAYLYGRDGFGGGTAGSKPPITTPPIFPSPITLPGSNYTLGGRR